MPAAPVAGRPGTAETVSLVQIRMRPLLQWLADLLEPAITPRAGKKMPADLARWQSPPEGQAELP